MRQYLDLMQRVLDEGAEKADRTGTGTLSVFGHQMRFDLSAGFPMLTTKKLHLRSIIHELLWFLKGETNVAYLQDNKVRIWDAWADEAGHTFCNRPRPILQHRTPYKFIIPNQKLYDLFCFAFHRPQEHKDGMSISFQHQTGIIVALQDQTGSSVALRDQIGIIATPRNPATRSALSQREDIRCSV